LKDDGSDYEYEVEYDEKLGEAVDDDRDDCAKSRVTNSVFEDGDGNMRDITRFDVTGDSNQESLPKHARDKLEDQAMKKYAAYLEQSDKEGSDEPEEVTCPICLLGFGDESIGEVVFKCGHGVHETCFEKHRTEAVDGDKCPTCSVTWELSDYGVMPPNAPARGEKKSRPTPTSSSSSPSSPPRSVVSAEVWKRLSCSSRSYRG